MTELSEFYKPAEENSQLVVNFIGNTSVIEGLGMKRIDPFQLLGAAEYLRMKGLQMISQAEMAEARRIQEESRRDSLNKIQVASSMPPAAYEGPGSGALKR